MDSLTSLSKDNIRNLFAKDALFYVKDPAVGQRAKEMQDMDFPIESAEGLDFYKQNVLDDARIRHVLEALFPWSGLGIYEVYRLKPDNIYAFLTGLEPELGAVVVQLWVPNSSMIFYGGSHKLPLRGIWASNGLLELPYPPLRKCEITEVTMENGGLAIFDARLAFQVVEGLAIYFVFATKKEVERGGPKKRFPGGNDLRAKAAGMESETIGMNFIFEGDDAS